MKSISENANVPSDHSVATPIRNRQANDVKTTKSFQNFLSLINKTEKCISEIPKINTCSKCSGTGLINEIRPCRSCKPGRKCWNRKCHNGKMTIQKSCTKCVPTHVNKCTKCGNTGFTRNGQKCFCDRKGFLVMNDLMAKQLYGNHILGNQLQCYGFNQKQINSFKEWYKKVIRYRVSKHLDYYLAEPEDSDLNTYQETELYQLIEKGLDDEFKTLIGNHWLVDEKKYPEDHKNIPKELQKRRSHIWDKEKREVVIREEFKDVSLPNPEKRFVLESRSSYKFGINRLQQPFGYIAELLVMKSKITCLCGGELAHVGGSNNGKFSPTGLDFKCKSCGLHIDVKMKNQDKIDEIIQNSWKVAGGGNMSYVLQMEHGKRKAIMMIPREGGPVHIGVVSDVTPIINTNCIASWQELKDKPECLIGAKKLKCNLTVDSWTKKEHFCGIEFLDCERIETIKNKVINRNMGLKIVPFQSLVRGHLVRKNKKKNRIVYLFI